ncbi:hypothetical protein A4R26_14905 [Niastella populi]|uniref:Uncharacterized protein n=1 Tax=Niastella populi TaxID=550983 RepID=A0A1V9G347_9BACT|nr:hypothetical protein A4R26_14905 [Niastella populi]
MEKYLELSKITAPMGESRLTAYIKVLVAILFGHNLTTSNLFQSSCIKIRKFHIKSIHQL